MVSIDPKNSQNRTDIATWNPKEAYPPGFFSDLQAVEILGVLNLGPGHRLWNDLARMLQNIQIQLTNLHNYRGDLRTSRMRDAPSFGPEN